MWENAVNEIIDGNFIEGLFGVIMAFVTTVVNLLLYPLNLLIENTLPNLATALESLTQYFVYAGTYTGWLINAFAIPSVVLSMVGAYWLFVFTTTIGIWSMKLLYKWKKAIWM